MVESVEFTGVNWDSKFATIKKGYYAPISAAIKWKGGACTTGAIKKIGNGMAREVFRIDGAPYALKMQEAKWADQSNNREYLLSKKEAFSHLLPRIYGCVTATHQGAGFSVLICELLQYDFLEYTDRIVKSPATTESVAEYLGYHAAFFDLVRKAAGELKMSVKDTHWKNVGLSFDAGNEPTLLLLDAEACSEAAKGTDWYSRAT